MADRVYIFDTTLRDGEQSPGCSMTVPEKLRMAAKLVDLGVDILEAGFPIASEGDSEAVDAVAREFPWAQRGGAGAREPAGCRWPRSSRCSNARRPRIHTFIATSDIHLKYKLKKSRAAGAGRSRGGGDAGARVLRRRRVFGRRRHAHGLGLSGRSLARGGRGGRAHGESAGYRRLLGAG